MKIEGGLRGRERGIGVGSKIWQWGFKIKVRHTHVRNIMKHISL